MHKEEDLFNREENMSMLDILTKNLDPDLAQQVKECWIDPNNISVNNLLGHGKFEMIPLHSCIAIVINLEYHKLTKNDPRTLASKFRKKILTHVSIILTGIEEFYKLWHNRIVHSFRSFNKNYLFRSIWSSLVWNF